MNEQHGGYTDFQMFLGITAGVAAGVIAGSLIATSIVTEQKKRTGVFQPEEWQRYFSFLSKATKTVMKDIPEIFHDINQNQRHFHPRSQITENLE